VDLDERIRTGLERAIGAALATRVAIVSAKSVAGGCIHRARRIDADCGGERRRWFAKVNTEAHAEMFEAEMDGLAALAKAGATRVPRAVSLDKGGDHASLVLEWLDLVPLTAASAARLGTALAAQHRQTVVQCGWHRGNFIGATPQVNGWEHDWLRFWKLNRLTPQLRLAAKHRLPSRMIDRGERLTTDCDALLAGHRSTRSLLHGDLWSGNAAALADGTPVLFDPAVYHGDREADIAMTELFGGFPADFLAAYGDAWPLEQGYATRRDFYNLYHVLNHANLFAGDYVRQAERSIERLLAEL
jgi:fructosamine-3-kinase